MADYSFSFPSDQFTVSGSPASLRDAAANYANFGKTASDASTSVRNLDTSAWNGDEADTVRTLLAQYPGPLSNVGSAFGDVNTALTTFAGVLETEQANMAKEREAAKTAWNNKCTADDAASDHSGGAWQKLGMSDDERTSWNEKQSTLDSASRAADNAWITHVHNADAILGRVKDAAATAKRQIDAAAQKSPTANQSWFERKWEQAGNWIDEKGAGIRKWLGEHATVLRWVGKAMEWVGDGLLILGAGLAAVSTAAGFFSFGIGWLGDLPAGAMMLAGGLLSGGGSILQTTADWGEGKIDGQDLLLKVGVDTTLTVLTLGTGKLAVKAGEKFLPKLLEKNPALATQVAKLFRGEATPASAGANRAMWFRDRNGDVTKAMGSLKQDFGSTARSSAEKTAQRTVDSGVRLRGDQGGHIIAHRFMQDQGLKNMFAQNGNLNTSAYKKLENEWAEWIDQGMEVKPSIELSRPDAGARVSDIKVNYDVVDPKTGKPVFKAPTTVFENRAGETFNRMSKADIREHILGTH